MAGLVLSAPAALALWLLLEWEAAPSLAALIALSINTVLTGALHEDGLADTADGFGGGRDREHALSIMKDSRTGSYGVIALVLSFGLRAAALASLAQGSAALPALALLSAAACSRALMVMHWHATSPARPGGVASGAGRPEGTARKFALASALLLALILLPACAGLIPSLLALGLALACVHGFTRYAEGRIGGHTGDTIGAAQQAGEIVFLTALALAV